VGKNGRRGEVDEIVQLDDVVRGVSVRFGQDVAYIDVGRIVDIDPVMRTLLVDEEH
jgi:hypothetical protein